MTIIKETKSRVNIHKIIHLIKSFPKVAHLDGHPLITDVSEKVFQLTSTIGEELNRNVWQSMPGLFQLHQKRFSENLRI